MKQDCKHQNNPREQHPVCFSCAEPSPRPPAAAQQAWAARVQLPTPPRQRTADRARAPGSATAPVLAAGSSPSALRKGDGHWVSHQSEENI